MVPRAFAAHLAGPATGPFKPNLLPTTAEVWKSVLALNQLGPRFTGNAAHRRQIDVIEADMQDAKLQTSRDTFTFPRWEARKWSLTATAYWTTIDARDFFAYRLSIS